MRVTPLAARIRTSGSDVAHPFRRMPGPAGAPILTADVSSETIPRRPRRPAVAAIIAIGYPSEATATLAADEARALAADLLIEPDAIAEIVRDKEGGFQVTSHHHTVNGGPTYGLFWPLLFGVLFFVPILGVTIGAGLAALMSEIEKSDLDEQFQQQVRDMVQPGTSALFLVVEKVGPDRVVAALARFAGTVLASPLSSK